MFKVEITTVSTFVFLDASLPPVLQLRGGDKLPSPSIKHPSSCSNWDPWTTARAVSHLLSCWYHSNDSLAKINQIFWKALYPLLRCVTDVRQTWLHLSPWRMVGCRGWMDASDPAETARVDKHGSIHVLYVQQWWKILKYYTLKLYLPDGLYLSMFSFTLSHNFISPLIYITILWCFIWTLLSLLM